MLQMAVGRARRSDGGSGEGKVTGLELFADGFLELQPEIRALIRAPA